MGKCGNSVSFREAKNNVCSIKYLIFNRSCSNFEYVSSKKESYFSAKFKNTIFKNRNYLYLTIINK